MPCGCLRQFKHPLTVPLLPRALSRSSESTLLAGFLAVHNERHHYPFHAPVHRCDNSLSALNLPSSAPSLIRHFRAGTCCEHAQAKYAKSWNTRIFTSFSDTLLPSRYTATSHARAPTTYLSIAHCTPPLYHHHHSRALSPHSSTTFRLPPSCTP